MKLPKLPGGLHLVRAVFDGGEGYADSQSFTVPLILW